MRNDHVPTPKRASTPRRLLLAGAIGSVLEWYDFTIFGAFAVVLAKVFFAGDDELTGILSTFAIFGVGFLARPLGAVLFGYLGDRVGRRRTLILTILLMAIPTTLMALVPTPAQIGVAATLSLVVLRFLQGLSAGGEVAGGYTFLSEQAPRGRYARTINWAGWVTFLGVLLGALVGALINAVLDPEQVLAYGWRLAFALNLVLLVAAAIVRRGLPETPEFEALRDAGDLAHNPVRTTIRSVPGRIVAGILTTSWQSVGVYFLITFVPAFLQVQDMVSPSVALLMSAVGIVTIIGGSFASGRLADRFGSRLVAMSAAGAMVLLGGPFWLLVARGDPLVAVIGLVGIAALFGLFYVAQVTMVNRSFPARYRYTGHSIAHNIAAALFGGTAALIAAWILARTGSPIAPIIWPIAVAALAGISCLLYPRYFAGERGESVGVTSAEG